jgi:hypothetical protein
MHLQEMSINNYKVFNMSKETLTAKLVREYDSGKLGQKLFFKLNNKIKVGKYFGQYVDIVTDVIKVIGDRQEYQYLKEEVKDGIEYICISDSKKHYERIVFAAFYDKLINDYRMILVEIDGVNTYIYNGGDKKTMKAPEVYLRRLSSFNDYEWGGIKS